MCSARSQGVRRVTSSVVWWAGRRRDVVDLFAGFRESGAGWEDRRCCVVMTGIVNGLCVIVWMETVYTKV